MYRLIKKSEDGVVVLLADQNQEVVLDELVEYVIDNASNGEEYTSCDLSTVREAESSLIGNYEVCIDEVKELTNDELIACGGGVCVHCHSDSVDTGTPSMGDGVITRILICNNCDEETVEVYSLTGKEG